MYNKFYTNIGEEDETFPSTSSDSVPQSDIPHLADLADYICTQKGSRTL